METKIAPVGKSYSALDFQADVVVCERSGVNVVSVRKKLVPLRCAGVQHTLHEKVEEVAR